MNSTEHDLLNALKGVGVLGLLRLAWAGLVKLAAWLPGYVRGERQQALDTRKVDIDEGKIAQAAKDTEAERILKQQTQLDTTMMGFLDKLQKQVDEQDEKISKLETRVATEEEQRRMAALSAEAAHIRADEAEVKRLKALTEIAELRQENANLRAVLAEANLAREADRLLISELNGRIQTNLAHIEGLELKLARFEHGTFELKLADPAQEPGS